MDAVREQLNRPLVAGIVGFIIGLIIGLPILGWGLWPVEWTDAAPEHLRADLQEQWLRMSVESYVLRPDPIAANQRYGELGENREDVLRRLIANPSPLAPESVLAFQQVVAAGAVATAPGTSVAVTPGATPVTGTPVEEEEGSWLSRVLLPAVMCLIMLLLGAAIVAILMMRRGKLPGGKVTTGGTTRPPDWSEYEAAGEEPPMAQFMASYKAGDDLFDDSFSIDSPGGEFLGECGVGISETIGVGDPKKVTAFEVWLFDKNDIQTVTKVLMSEHAFEDDTIRLRLAAKGEPVLATTGGEVVLETQTLQLVARVVDMGYGDGALPENSHFDNLVLQLAVWQK